MRVIIVGFLECAHVQAQQRIIPVAIFIPRHEARDKCEISLLDRKKEKTQRSKQAGRAGLKIFNQGKSRRTPYQVMSSSISDRISTR